MPCYTVRLVSVQFKAQNEEILKSAARLLNWEYRVIMPGEVIAVGPVTVYLKNQTAEAREQEHINTLKRSYTEAAVKAAARVKGWTLQPWKTKTGSKEKETTAIKY